MIWKIRCCVIGVGLVVGVASGVLTAEEKTPTPGAKIDFNRDVRPLLSDKCFTCHGPDERVRKADLRLDVEANVFDVSEVVVRGNAQDSELVQRIFSDDPDVQMPPKSSNRSLTDAEKDILRRWVEQGAPWAMHWAYVPPERVAIPAGSNPIDHFIGQRLAVRGLKSSPPADRVTLIRRLYFDLLGLPPTPAQVDAFVADRSPNAVAKIVDQLLASPHHGERMAVYWLDVVRYADSNGYHSDEARKISPYRTYVIDSFHKNKPYDEFVLEQLAGDLLPESGLEQQIASGFNMLLQTTSEGGAQADEYIAKYAADRVRNTAQIFLGSTLGCAECHNHKFDPFTQQDFYSFAAFFADIQQPAVGNPATFPVSTAADQTRIAAFDGELADLAKQLEASTPALLAEQAAWETRVGADAVSTPAFGPWYVVGPFRAASLDAAYARDWVNPAEVKLDAKVESLAWSKLDALKDGAIFAFPTDANSARYVFRIVNMQSAGKLKLSLGSDDTLTVWVNGAKVHDNKVSRGVVADQDKVEVSLVEGENQLLFRICNGGGGHGFYFRGGKSDLPSGVVAILKLAAADRSEAQAAEIAKYFRSLAPSLQPVRDRVAKATQDKKQFVDSRPRTMMTKTGAVRTVRLLNRGNWLDKSGPEMAPAIPGFLGALDAGDRRANRLDLAEWIVDPKNPLASRTFVNRLWKLYFGQGLATPLDDFGRQGTLPTHPELLDWLSVEFVESGWDVRHIVRLMVSSQTYQQVSTVSDTLHTEDPRNRLYSRQARFRIDAEFVRDNALAISGLLVSDVGGESVHPYQPAGYWRHMNFPTRTWPQASGDAMYRRGVYTWWQRMFLHPSMLAFDAPSREECTVERPQSNIPQQALVLLNDPTYVEAARAFAGRIVLEGGESSDDRVRWAWKQVVSREAEDREVAVVLRLLEKHQAQYVQDPAAAKALLGVGMHKTLDGVDEATMAAWTSVARVILNLHEAITRY
jgi:hypothetical protein